MKHIPQSYLFISLIVLFLLSLSPPAYAQTPIPKVTIGIDPAQTPQDVAVTIQILILLTILTLSPSILVLMTSFTRLVVVFHLVRQAIGLQNVPPNPVLIGLALFLTFFLMQGTIAQIHDTAWVPYREKEITIQEAFRLAQEPIKTFMLRQTRPKDLALMISFAHLEQPQTPQQLSLGVIVPGFVISELRTAFQIGFLIYLPFLVIDMIISSVLMSMGMLMLPPAMISLPFKLLLFVLADGWYLLVQSLLTSFH